VVEIEVKGLYDGGSKVISDLLLSISMSRETLGHSRTRKMWVLEVMGVSKGAAPALGPRPTTRSRHRIGQKVIEAERITIERLADMADVIRSQDVERKGA
jgi:hypothetical protein